MHIAELIVTNFRGIKELRWRPYSGLNCLVGPGDGTKSTILAAIEYVLSPSWSIAIDETDFFNLTTTQPITITATIVDPPAAWLREDAFGMLQRGWHNAEGVHDEPLANDLPALTIRFTVGGDCEPHWHIIVGREPNEKIISAKQRALCNTVRTDIVDRQLTWSAGTLLTRATTDPEQTAATLAKATKAAREAIRAAEHQELTAAATTLQTRATHYAVRPKGTYTAALDSKMMQVRAGCLTLHDDVVPSRLFGLGSKRLLTLVLQEIVTSAPGITLVDEFEHGLEPHRIRRLLRKLRDTNGQTILTTHSPVCIHELAPDSLQIVRSANNTTTVQGITDGALRKSIRAAPESILARRILVCEGPTEVGMICALDDHWSTATEPMASLGALPIDGEGSSSPKRARDFKALGYDVMIFGDSDGTIAAQAATTRAADIAVAMWDGAVCTEQQIFDDMPWAGVQELLTIVLKDRDEQGIRNQVVAKIPPGTTIDVTGAVATWQESAELRDVLGRAAAGSGWYKQLHLGEDLGSVIGKYLAAMDGKNTALVLESVRAWLHRG